MKNQRRLPAFVILLSVLLFSIITCYFLGQFFEDNNPFAALIFILAVVLVSRFTDGYLCGIIAAVVGVFCVNFLFTYPFGEFNLEITGYPLTFIVMLLVSLIISTLTTQVKQQETIRFEAKKEKMRANLLRSLSHDIRTPLASIMGASSTLLENESLPDADRRDLLTDIHREAAWLVRMTENMLSVTKLSDDGAPLKKTDEVVEEIVGSAIVKFRKNLSNLPILVTRPEEIIMAPMDAMLIEQVVLNLLENVTAHAEKATCIHVVLEHDAVLHRVVISVADDGVGIAPWLLPRVFDGYSSVTERDGVDGKRNMGIGLSVCNSIICAHEGEMSARNNEYGGATFSFWLPCEEVTDEQYIES